MSLRIREEQGFGVTIIIVIILALGLTGLVGWKGYEYFNKPKGATNQSTKSDKGQDTKTTSGTTITKPNVFKIPELGVEFDEVGGVMPVYYGEVFKDPSNSKNTIVELSTQKIIDEGKLEGKAGNDRCGLNRDDIPDYFSLADIHIYNSVTDAIDDVPWRIYSDINPSNGYLNIKGQIFSIPTTYSMDQPCTNTPTGNAIEKQQFELLRQSLMTIRAME